MKPNTLALRLGLFMLVGLALLVAAIAFVLGGQVFSQREPIQMRFSGSVYGLQVGSPVVFRGVAIGNVSTIGLALNDRSGQIEIPVMALLDQKAVKQLGPVQASPSATLQSLLDQGLSARLATQSLLTGQLYVDLDLRPQAVSAQHHEPSHQSPQAGQGLPDVPTLPTSIQALQSQLEGVDLKAALSDVAAIASATRQWLQDPQLKATVANMAQLSAELRGLTQSLQREVRPISGATQQTLAQVQLAATALAEASGRMAHTAQTLDATLAADAPLLQSVQQTARELTATASSLRDTTGPDAELVQHLSRAARDVAQAARQLTTLTQLLERQPEALLRGRKTEPNSP